MNKKFYILIFSIIIIASSNAQLLSNQPNEIIPNNLNGNLNYNFNQGLGFFILKNKTNNITFEIGPSFDNSDYLNSQIRTSYLKNSYSIDLNSNKFKTKAEVDYLYEISKNLKKETNSKLQLMIEISFFINNSNSITIGVFQDYLNKEIENNSLSFSYSISKPINIKI